MFQIIESLNNNFIRLPILKNEIIKSGNVVELTEYDNDIYCKLSNGEKPFGICGGKKNNYIQIWTQLMLFRSDKYDKQAEYSPGDLLYVFNGNITTVKPFENCYTVGNVVYDFRKEKGCIEAKWL